MTVVKEEQEPIGTMSNKNRVNEGSAYLGAVN